MKHEGINFFSPLYKKEDMRNDLKFGINDREGDFAYSIVKGSDEEWNAYVDNSARNMVLFTPIDHNIVIYDDSNNQLSLCDGMLSVSDKWLAFIELKIDRKDWITKGVAQLRYTIDLFVRNHGFLQYKKRLAYLVNKKHPFFHASHKQKMNEFHSQTHFRLLIQRLIEVK